MNRRAPAIALLLLVVACEDAPKAEAPPPAGFAGTGAGPGAPGATTPPADSLLAKPMDAVFVVVNGTALTRADFGRAVSQQLRAVGAPLDALPPELRAIVENRAFDAMIEREVLRQKGAKDGLAPSPEAIDKAIAEIVSRMPPGKTLQDFLTAQKLDEATFRREVETNITVGGALEAAERAIPAVDEAVAKQVFDENPGRFTDNRSARARQIIIAVPRGAPAEAFAAAKTRADEVHALVAGKDEATFEKVARERSEDPRTREQGGDLGTVTPRDVLPDLVDVVFKLKAGEVSPVVPTERGFHIIFGKGITNGKPKTFADVKDDIVRAETPRRKAEGIKAFIDGAVAAATVEKKVTPAPMPAMPPPGGMGPPGGMPPGAAMAPPGHGAPAGDGAGGGHGAIPLPSRDNVMPGAPNPHGGGGGELKLGGDDPGLKLPGGGAGGH